jgi:hypothetical protein
LKVRINQQSYKDINDVIGDGPWTSLSTSINDCIKDERTTDEIIRGLDWVVAPSFLYDRKYLPLFKYFTSRIVDRTQTFDDIGFNQIIEQPLPTMIDFTAPDLETIIDNTAQEIIESTTLPLAVLWSGGLDSTTAIVALLEAGADRITAVHTESSTQEHPWLYQWLVDHEKIDLLKVDRPYDWLRSEARNQYTIVTGEGGGEIHVTLSFRNFVSGSGNLIDDYDSPELLRMMLHPEPLYMIDEPYKSLLMPIIDRAPRTYKHNVDWMWWLTWALKSGILNHRMTLNTGVMQPNLIHFFMNDQFERWALVNDCDVKIPGCKWVNYKMPMRDYLYRYFNDQRVYEMKKYASMPTAQPDLADRNNPSRRTGIIRIGSEYVLETFGHNK